MSQEKQSRYSSSFQWSPPRNKLLFAFLVFFVGTESPWKRRVALIHNNSLARKDYSLRIRLSKQCIGNFVRIFLPNLRYYADVSVQNQGHRVQRQ